MFAPPTGAKRRSPSTAGRVLLIVNTASKCGFTPQYDGLEALWRQHRDAGLVVLGFPCNQFGGQEPGHGGADRQLLQHDLRRDLPVMAKVEVNGAGADPLFQWLKREKPGLLGIGAIKWNFTKFLVGARRPGDRRASRPPPAPPRWTAPRCRPRCAAPAAP